MTKAVLKEFDDQIKQRRQQVSQLQSELEELEDYLDVLEARRQSVGKKKMTQAEMEKRFAIK